MTAVELKDGSIVDVYMDPTWGPEEQQRAIREYKAANAPAPDASETDSWPTYLGKEALAIGRGGAAGLASTADTLSNLMPGVGIPSKIAGRLWNDKPLDWSVLNPFSGDQPTRDVYEKYVPEGPKGSDYETTGKVAEVLVPAIAETALTGSPKTALIRGPLSAGLGYAGAKVGEFAGEKLGGEQGAELGRLLGSVLAPGFTTRTGVKLATLKTGGPLLGRIMRSVGLGNPYDLIPKTSLSDLAGRAAAGYAGGTPTADDAEQAEAERQRQREIYRQQTGR